MLSNKSYLIRAFYDWIVDSQCTPLFVINASFPRCNVPQAYVENGEIILNASPNAVRDFKISHKLVEFRASFAGVAHIISVPIQAVLAIYAEENGQGMFFDGENDDSAEMELIEESKTQEAAAQPALEKSQDGKKKSHLTLVE